MKTDETRWNSAALRICSERTSPKTISEKFSIQKAKHLLKGEHLSKRNPKSAIREVNLWLLDSGLSDQEPLESHIEELLSFLREKEDVVRELQTDCEFEIMCVYASTNGQGGFVLGRETLREMAKYTIDLIVSLYPPEEQ